MKRITISESRAEQSRAEQSRAEQSSIDNALNPAYYLRQAVRHE